MIIYGKNVIKEAIINHRRIDEILLDHKFNDKGLLNLINRANLKVTQVSKGELNTLTNNANHQGIIAKAAAYQFQTLEAIIDVHKVQRFLILDELQDPHNLGAILRSAEATSLDGIIIGKSNQVGLTAAVAKVSAGAIEYVPVIQVSNIYQTILKLKKDYHFLMVGTDMVGSTNYTDLPTDQSIAIVLGNEGVGIRPIIKKSCDILASIPMLGKVNSLNVSVAAALMLYGSFKK
jgi:23S rRNA (guanosine2251-2'-O)-methyltransferase/cation-transporting ATPase E